MERDHRYFESSVAVNISTHTLTWSVTDKLYKATPDEWISTHTLTWSVTVAADPSVAVDPFQLTRSRGA